MEGTTSGVIAGIEIGTTETSELVDDDGRDSAISNVPLSSSSSVVSDVDFRLVSPIVGSAAMLVSCVSFVVNFVED
jgi:hypothetical protein